jgi:hypothetical protein
MSDQSTLDLWRTSTHCARARVRVVTERRKHARNVRFNMCVCLTVISFVIDGTRRRPRCLGTRAGLAVDAGSPPAHHARTAAIKR